MTIVDLCKKCVVDKKLTKKKHETFIKKKNRPKSAKNTSEWCLQGLCMQTNTSESCLHATKKWENDTIVKILLEKLRSLLFFKKISNHVVYDMPTIFSHTTHCGVKEFLQHTHTYTHTHTRMHWKKKITKMTSKNMRCW